jgi:hypothetical protein
MSTHSNTSSDQADGSARRRLPATQRSLKGSLFGTIFTTTGLLASDFRASAPSTAEPFLSYPFPPEPHRQQTILHQLRDDVLDGQASSLESIVVAAWLARRVCLHVKRPVRSDLAAAALRVAAELSRAVRKARPDHAPCRRTHMQLDRLGWAGLGPAFTDQVFDAQADALESRGPYCVNASAVAAVTTCLEQACLCRAYRLDLGDVCNRAGLDLRKLLAMSLLAFSQPAPDRDIAGVGPPPLFRVAHRWSCGHTEVTARLDAPVSVVISVAPGIAPLVLSAPGLWALCATLLCGDADEAAQAPHVCLRRVEGAALFHLQGLGVNWHLLPESLQQLQRTVGKVLFDERCQAQLRRIELTRGCV